MLLKLIKSLIGSLSDEDKEKLKLFIEELLKAAAKGAVEGAIKNK